MITDYPVVTVSELKRNINSYLEQLTHFKKIYITVNGKVVGVLETVEQKGIIAWRLDLVLILGSSRYG